MSAAKSPSTVEPSPVLIRMAPEWRRIGVYLLIGYAAIIAATAWAESVGAFRDGRRPAWIGVHLIGFACIALAVLTLRQVLRVDGDGIWRRRMFRWDLWPWSAFSQGLIRHGTSLDSYVFPAKPWWNRRLLLEFLASPDRAWLAGRIRQVWRPPFVRVPERMIVKHGFGDRLTISAGGLRVSRWRDEGQIYPWSAVQHLVLTRIDHSRRDFRILEITVPDRPNPIRVPRFQNENEVCTVVEREAMIGLLQRFLPAERIEYTALSGPPATIAEADRRLAEVDRREIQDRNLDRIVAPICILSFVIVVAFLVWMPVKQLGHWTDWLGYIFFSVVFGMLFVLTWYDSAAARKHFREKRAELLRWRDSLRS